MGAKLKILVVGGVPESLLNFRFDLLHEMAISGFDVTAAAGGYNAVTVSRLNGIGVKYVELPLQRTSLSITADIRYALCLASLCRTINPDVLIPYTHKPVIYTAIMAGYNSRSTKVFPIITGLGYVFIGKGFKARFAKWMVLLLYRHASRYFTGVLFQNPDDHALFRSLNLIRLDTPHCIVRGSGIDLSRFLQAAIVADVTSPHCLRFLLIARLLGDKGIREYAAAAFRIKKDYPDVEFHLIGPTDPNPAAISLTEVRGWQREGVIVYHGAQQDIRPFMQNCSVYVLPSYREGTPRTVLEAMATGRAVITTDAPGCRETVFDAGPSDAAGIRTGGNGLMVPVKSVDALEAAMRRFIENPDLALKMGQAGRRLAEEHYDVHKVNRQMLEFMGLREPTAASE